MTDETRRDGNAAALTCPCGQRAQCVVVDGCRAANKEEVHRLRRRYTISLEEARRREAQDRLDRMLEDAMSPRDFVMAARSLVALLRATRRYDFVRGEDD